jgi:superoxide reductase
MIKKKKVYFCENCGNVVEALRDGKSIICCGQEMVELRPKTAGPSAEDHVPVIERQGSKVSVSVGEAPHPMDSEEYVLFIEVLAGDKVLRHDFKEGDQRAEALFFVEEGVPVKARAYCEFEGLWESN